MSYIGVLAIAAFNCAALFFLSFLAAGGDGSIDGIRTVWLFGYSWIALITIAAIILCAVRRGIPGLLVAASALPTAYMVSVGAIALGAGLTYFKPVSSEFSEACKSAGSVFIAAPTEPVRSLAYEWGREYPVELNYFLVAKNYSLSAVETRNPPYPPGLTLVDNKQQRADVLIKFTYPTGKDELPKALSRQGMVGYEVAVIDQRDSRILANLRYFTDHSNNRACGATSDGVLSIRWFVLRAIGMQ